MIWFLSIWFDLIILRWFPSHANPHHNLLSLIGFVCLQPRSAREHLKSCLTSSSLAFDPSLKRSHLIIFTKKVMGGLFMFWVQPLYQMTHNMSCICLSFSSLQCSWVEYYYYFYREMISHENVIEFFSLWDQGINSIERYYDDLSVGNSLLASPYNRRTTTHDLREDFPWFQVTTYISVAENDTASGVMFVHTTYSCSLGCGADYIDVSWPCPLYVL